MGRGFAAGRQLADANVIDVAPTLLRLLDVRPPERLDGRPIAVFDASASRRKSTELPGFVQ
jgi:arylsulfatase A-like enzyme